MSINQLMPINYVRLIARELQLKEGDLAQLLQDTALEPADLQTGGATLTVAILCAEPAALFPHRHVRK